jgi:hypothetical protein
MGVTHRRTRRLLGTILGGALVLGLAVVPAHAVDELNILEMDGDIAADGNAANGTDWGTIFTNYANASTVCPGEVTTNVGTTPAGTIDTVFVCDHEPGATGPDPTHWEPSTKDDQPVNADDGSGVWRCQSVTNPTDKDEIVNAYSLAATVPAGGPANDVGDLVLYAAGERYDNSGDAFYGVWFFQQEVGCNTSTGFFEGSKTDGDILVLVDIDGGGTVDSVQVFTWHPSVSAPDTSPGTFQLVTSSADCASAVDPSASNDDDACAAVRVGAMPFPAWPAQEKKEGGPTKTLNQYDTTEFFEVGINLTDVFAGGNQGQEPCISSYLTETRSSSSIDATLKDFAAGSLDTCGSIRANKYRDGNADGNDEGDQNADGVSDPGATEDDPGLPGWTIFIDGNANQLLDTVGNSDCVLDAGEADANSDGYPDGEQCRITDASGDVLFDGIRASATPYSVCEVLTTGWINSDPGNGTVGDPNGSTLCENVSVTVGGTSFVNFGNYQTFTIAGTKFKDADADGIKDASETGLSGWTLLLFKDDDGGGDLDASEAGTADATTVTLIDDASTVGVDETGKYAFTGLVPGKYIVCERIGDDTSTAGTDETQVGWAQTYPGSSTTGSVSCAAASTLGAASRGWSVQSVASGTVGGKDFGNAPLSTLSVTFTPQADLPGGSDATQATSITCDGAGSAALTDQDADSTDNDYVSPTFLTNESSIVCTITFQDP